MTLRLVGVMRLLLTSHPGAGSRTSTEEVYGMTEPTSQGSYKTIGVKLPDPIHAQLVLIAGLENLSLTDAIKAAIDSYIDRKRGEGDLAARAAQVAAEIERAATAQREALEALFGPQAPAPDKSAKPTAGRGKADTP